MPNTVMDQAKYAVITTRYNASHPVQNPHTPRPPNVAINDRTSETPSPDYREDRLGGPLATSKCSGSGKHARREIRLAFYLFGLTGEWALAYVTYAPSDCALLARMGGLVSLALDACGSELVLCLLVAIVRAGSLHRSMMWFLQMAQLSTTMSQAQSETAFHYKLMSVGGTQEIE